MRCIAIDDEPLALRQISGYISKIPFLELAANFRSAVAAQEWLQKNEIDLIFVDINMPDMT
ncbi:MAG: response regulator, partial [Alistipes sp.]|nr:response regulator [Alistipes sp.]